MLKILNSERESYGSIIDFVHQSPLRTTHDGKLGGNYDTLVYVKNDDPTLYYVDVQLKPVSSTYDDVEGEWGETGFGLKALYGERRPTETEWDQIVSGEPIDLPDIGTTDAADAANYYPCWVRAIVPGMSSAQIKSNIKLQLIYRARNVGS